MRTHIEQHVVASHSRFTLPLVIYFADLFPDVLVFSWHVSVLLSLSHLSCTVVARSMLKIRFKQEDGEQVLHAAQRGREK